MTHYKMSTTKKLNFKEDKIMWSKLLLISDKKYDLDWIREERELIDAGRYSDNLSEENQKHYDLFHERFEKFYFSKDIPEIYYRDLNDKGIIWRYENECRKYSEEYCNSLLEAIKSASKEESSEYLEYLKERYEKYKKDVPTIEEYINSIDKYVVRDGKIYTTKNYIDGIIDFIGRREWTDLISKSGEHTPALQVKDIDIEASEVGSAALVIDDTDLSYRYSDGRGAEQEKFYNETVQMIKNLPPEKYVYLFGYHF